jgi:hypothetical protein
MTNMMSQANILFAKLVEKRGHSCPIHNVRMPQQNGVAKRHNCTLTDMVRSMISFANVPIFLWNESLKAAKYILNKILSKVIPTISFELWISRKSSLRHLNVWSCPAVARIYNPQEYKLDSRIIFWIFYWLFRKV